MTTSVAFDSSMHPALVSLKLFLSPSPKNALEFLEFKKTTKLPDEEEEGRDDHFPPFFFPPSPSSPCRDRMHPHPTLTPSSLSRRRHRRPSASCVAPCHLCETLTSVQYKIKTCRSRLHLHSSASPPNGLRTHPNAATRTTPQHPTVVSSRCPSL